MLCVCCTNSLSIYANVRLAVKAMPTSLTVGVTTEASVVVPARSSSDVAGAPD